MPDTCLDTTKSQSPDVRLMRAAERLANIPFRWIGDRAEALCVVQELQAIASDLRATIGRPSEQAANVIQVLQATTTRGDVDTAWLDLAATVRQLPPCEQSRVIVEARIAEAKAAKKGMFW